MRSNSLRSLCLLAAGCLGAAGCERTSAESSRPATIQAPVEAELSSSARQYVQGQPIQLTLVLVNRRGTPLRFERRDVNIWEAPFLYLSMDGKNFLPCEPEPRDAVEKTVRATETLQPAGSITYRFRALHGWKSENCRWLIQPGRLWIQVRYPIAEWSLDRPYPRIGQFEARSNTVEVKIREATAEDAMVWKTLREERLLRFLQTDTGDIATVEAALDLARKHDASSYHRDLKASLEAYYRHVSVYDVTEVQASPEWKAVVEDLRQWLGIPKPGETLFLDDKRLEATFSYDAAEQMRLGEVVHEASQAARVPLRLSDDFPRAKVVYSFEHKSVRWYLEDVAGRHNGQWIRDGDGYKLVPKPKDKAKPAEGPR